MTTKTMGDIVAPHPLMLSTMDDANGLLLAFVGSTNPVLGCQRLVEGTRRLAQRTDVDCLIVNTSGLLAGSGRSLKAAKIDALRPDLLIAVGDGQPLEAIAHEALVLSIVCVQSSPEARRKTDGERRTARQEASRQYFWICCKLPSYLQVATKFRRPAAEESTT